MNKATITDAIAKVISATMLFEFGNGICNEKMSCQVG
jgi:hypothetical protein